jgi:N-acetylneuraminic acid mutarotase
VYDPETDNWTTETNPPTNGTFPSCVSAVFGDKIYVIGGISEDQHFVLNRIYDTKTDSWSYGSSPPSSVGGGTALTTTGVYAPQRIYVIGYTINLRIGEENRFTRIYDPETDNWTYGEDIPTKRWNFGATTINDTIYIIGGHDHQWIPGNFKPLTKNEQYTPAEYIPEFPAWLTLPLVLGATFVVAVVRRKVFRPT